MRLKHLLCTLFAFSAAGGCDDTTTGQLTDDPGPPKLARLVVQDQASFTTDLLDDQTVACSYDNPCVVVGTVAGTPPSCNIPDGATDGTCDDPFLAGPISIGPPVSSGGIMVRIVFSKLLDPSVETVTVDPTSGSDIYMLTDPTMIDLQDANGQSVDSTKYWDPTGSPYQVSYSLYEPFGPALVIKPSASLNVSSKYTVILNPAKAVDKQKQAAVAQDGTALPSTYSKDFTTVDLSVAGITPTITPDPMTMALATIAPNDTIQASFNADVSAVSASLKLGTTIVPINVFEEQGSDPTMCTANANPRAWNIQPTVGRFPAGTYTLTIASATDAGRSMDNAFLDDMSMSTQQYTFVVGGSDDSMATTHIMASDCVATDGGV